MTQTEPVHIAAAFHHAVQAVVDLFAPVTRILFGYDVIPDDQIPIGAPVFIEHDLHAHPLDVIAMQHRDDPIGRLNAAMDWITADAHRKLDDVEHRMTAALAEVVIEHQGAGS